MPLLNTLNFVLEVAVIDACLCKVNKLIAIKHLGTRDKVNRGKKTFFALRITMSIVCRSKYWIDVQMLLIRLNYISKMIIQILQKLLNKKILTYLSILVHLPIQKGSFNCEIAVLKFAGNALQN